MCRARGGGICIGDWNWEPLLNANDCTSKDPSVKLLKFADDTTLISLIQNGDESAYKQEVKELAAWCSLNNLELNTLKTVEMIVDFRRNPPALPPLTILNSTVTAVESFRFLGTTISQDLKWDIHIDSIVKKGPAEGVLPSPTEEVQPATGDAEKVLLGHHWICPLHINNCLYFGVFALELSTVFWAFSAAVSTFCGTAVALAMWCNVMWCFRRTNVRCLFGSIHRKLLFYSSVLWNLFSIFMLSVERPLFCEWLSSRLH